MITDRTPSSSPAGDVNAPLVLVIDDDEDTRALLHRWLTGDGYRVECAESGESALRSLHRMLPDAVCLDLELPGWSGLETLARIRAHHPRLPVVILTADSAVGTVVSAVKSGAWDYLVKPIDRTKLSTTLRNAVERSRMAVQLAQLEREASGHPPMGLVGESPAMRSLLRQIDRVAPTDVTVLIQGESGTGKELVARAIHEGSARSAEPWVAVNCAAVPETLQESELFGHERGAFTGAATRHLGRFEQANRGTLFLDEVAELSPSAQAKLLRVLQERRFHRVGGGAEVASDFRLIAASHRDLADEVAAGRFREDLYFRLAVFDLAVPPLRERGGDVVSIARAFLAERAAPGARPLRLSSEAQTCLMSYPWPGNVRELRNAMERASVVAASDEIAVADLPHRVRQPAAAPAPEVRAAASVAAAPAGGRTLDDLERDAIVDALRKAHNNRTEAGRALGIGRSTLYRKLKKYSLES